MKLEVKMTKEELDTALAEHLGLDHNHVELSGFYVWSDMSVSFDIRTGSDRLSVLQVPTPTKEPPSTATSINFSDDIPF